MHRRLPICLATCILTLFPTTADRRAMREGYLGMTEFSTYRDLAPPIVRLADDLSQGWLMAQVEVEGTQRTEAGEETDQSLIVGVKSEALADFDRTYRRVVRMTELFHELAGLEKAIKFLRQPRGRSAEQTRARPSEVA